MSHTPATGVSPYDRYVRYFEYARVITEVVVTDEGVYLKGEVPDSYGGAQLEIKAVNAVFMVNYRGELSIFEFELDPPMDKTKQTGGPITRDGVEIREAVGPSTTPVPQVLVLNDKLDDDRKQMGQLSYEKFKADAEAANITPS